MTALRGGHKRRFSQTNYKTAHVVGLSLHSLEHALEQAQRRVNEVLLDSCLFRIKRAGKPPAPNYRAAVIGLERTFAAGAIYYRVLVRVELLAPVRQRSKSGAAESLPSKH
jgi:hypothetical protein